MNKEENLIITIGAFDGIHLGHKKLFLELNEEKNKKGDNYKTAVLTFEKHPDFYLNKRNEDFIIESNKNRYNEFETFDIDYLFLLEKDVLSLSYELFHQNVLNKINTKVVIVGEEFRYGFKAQGNIDTLKEDYVIKTFLVLKNNGEKVSSTEIRSLLSEGKINEASKLLGHNYCIDCFINRTGNDILLLEKKDGNIALAKGCYEVKYNIKNEEYYGIATVTEKMVMPQKSNFFQMRCNEEVKIEFLKYLGK